MDKEIRILILEDVPADAELEEHELRKAGLVFISQVVDTKEAFLKALEEFLPDIILSDYDLPYFDGIAALRIAKEKCPDVPFIIVSGKVGEDFAIEKLKEGATDYVLKNNLKRLVPSVKRALQEAEEITERERAEEELIKEKEFIEIALDSQLDTFFVFEPSTGKAIRWNKSFRDISGYTDEEIASLRAPNSYYSPEDLEKAVSFMESIKRDGKGRIELSLICKDGHQILTEYETSVISGQHGEPEHIIAIGRDITERKQAEQQLATFKTFVEASILAYGFADLNGDIFYINPALCCILGLEKPEDALGTNVEIYYPDNMKSKLLNEVLPTVKNKGGWAGEIPLQSIKGKLTHTIQNVSLIHDDKGKPLFIGNIITDITERKKAEEALKESEERFKDLFESANDLIQIVDAEGKFVYVNRKWRELLGFTDNEARQMKFTNIVRKDQIPHCTEVFQRVVNGESIDRLETVFISKDGRESYVEGSLNPSFKEGEFVSCRGIFRDITERKKAEELEHERTDQIILNKEALLELTMMQTPDLETFSKIITLMSSQVLGVERVSVWFYNNVRSEIICEALYILSKHSHEKGFRLQSKDYPKYFKALEEDTVLSADDAHTDPRTNEFTEQYLKPLGIFSMMDIPIRRHGKVIGIICYEHTEPRQWTYEDQNFATAVAQIIRSSLEDFDRKKAEDALQDSKEELQKRVKDLEDFYQMAVGRELRMKELKEQMKELQEELAKYKKQ